MHSTPLVLKRPNRSSVGSTTKSCRRSTGPGPTAYLERRPPRTLGTRAAGLADIIRRFRGIIDDGYLETKARIVLARAMGDTPEIEASARPLYVQDYMREQGVSSDDIKSYAPTFGKYVKKAYKAERGVEPGKRFDETPSGQVREVCVYTEADRPIFDRAWSESYANGFPEKKEAKKNKEKK